MWERNYNKEGMEPLTSWEYWQYPNRCGVVRFWYNPDTMEAKSKVFTFTKTYTNVTREQMQDTCLRFAKGIIKRDFYTDE
jgi:hypothetical protein